MFSFLMNPWTVAIGSGIIVVAVSSRFYFRKNKSQGTVGILNSGRGTTITNCSFEGFDTSIDNRGKETRVENTKFK